MRPLISCLCCASDARSDAYREICEGIFHQPPRFHRKQWENVYILHMLREAGVLEIGKRGLGFGCGREILVPAFAALGCEVLATDQDAESTAASGWIETSQHSSSLTDFAVYLPRVCSEADFLGRVRHRTVDMNGIPPDLLNGDYDFAWSCCSLDHLGSLRNGLEFIKQSIRCVRPGGFVVHTTEFNVSSDEQTVESKGLSIYRTRDLLAFEREVGADGHRMYPLDLHSGSQEEDRHLDRPPYPGNDDGVHLHLEIEGFDVTSVGILIQRGEAETKQ